jgi:hypothetical protein
MSDRGTGIIPASTPSLTLLSQIISHLVEIHFIFQTHCRRPLNAKRQVFPEQNLVIETQLPLLSRRNR